MQGRLALLLAMGLAIRHAAAALAFSRVTVEKVLKRNPALSEQANAARFQPQIEPLVAVFRESKRNWRAATRLMNYLSKSVAGPERESARPSLGNAVEILLATQKQFLAGDGS